MPPDQADFWMQQGLSLRSQGQWQSAITRFRQALALRPNDPQLLFILGNTFQAVGEQEQAILCFEKSLALRPDHAELIGNLGSACRDTGQLDRAIACYRRTLELKPDARIAADNLLLALLYHPASTPQSLLAESQRWNAQYASPLAQFFKPHTNNRDPDRPLRIGYVSPDLANHPIGRFMLPLLSHHHRKQFEIFCYSQIQKPDEMTAVLQSHSHTWRNIFSLSDEQVAEQIRNDQIDILVDLAMHSAKNRLLTFARKPAPIQVTYLGYAGGCALDTIDYRLTDRFLDSDPTEDICYLQKAFRLNATYWCYQNSRDVPVSPLPAISSPNITLGCLNNFCKMSDASLETWAQILLRIPNAKLLLHAPQGSPRDRLLQFLAAKSVASNRVEFIGRVHPEEYFKAYHRIDVALDSIPYAGGTTTCDALWMGVPVVTLAGRTPVGRAGVSILNNAGHPEWIARNIDEYVNIVANLACDLPKLSQIRSALRNKLQASALMDSAAYTASIESAYRTMWQTWVADGVPNAVTFPHHEKDLRPPERIVD